MASWREIDRIRKAPAEFRALAKRLLNLGAELTDWESIFLESIRNDTETKEFTTRQSEKLLQIRDGYETLTKFQGFSVEILLDKCWLALSTFPRAKRKAKKIARAEPGVSAAQRNRLFDALRPPTGNH